MFALAGRAWIRHERGDDKAAVADLLRAADLRPDSMDQDDGLKRKPRGIAIRLHGAMVSGNKTELAAKLQSLLP